MPDDAIVVTGRQASAWRYFKGNSLLRLPERWNYSATVKIGETTYETLRETLGYVKPRKDGRFDWFVCEAPYRDDWPVRDYAQGVAPTLGEAREIVERVWDAPPPAPSSP